MTNTLTKVSMVVIGAILAVASYGFVAATQVDAKGKPGADKGTIVDIAIKDGRFSTLATALTCTGLIDRFNDNSNRQYTVFAPTDAAFAIAGLDATNVCDFPGIANVLAYHVSPGVKTSKTVLNRSSLNMLNRQMAPVDASTVTIANAPISATNLRATNGIVHVIDAVMLPN